MSQEDRPIRLATKNHEIDSLAELRAHIAAGRPLSDHVVRGVDVSSVDLGDVEVEASLFLGCVFGEAAVRDDLQARGAYVFPRFAGLPYDPYRNTLYTPEELLAGYDEGGYGATVDFQTYADFDRGRLGCHTDSIRDALAQRIHDHAIDEALNEIVDRREGRGVVGVMGGHSTLRTAAHYRDVAELTWRLTREGYFVASGGGPGLMEAANLGAYLANYADEGVLDAAIAVLAEAPRFDGGEPEGTAGYLEAIRRYVGLARDVVATFGPDASPELAERYARERPEPGESLAVPTWFYGHEPTNLFSPHIAKYFSNSIREDTLLAISRAGVVFAPGSAGTLQEVFMDLAQNHYATFFDRSPMCFLGCEAYAPVVDLIRGFLEANDQESVYRDMVACFDAPAEIVDFIKAHPPRRRPDRTPLYELI